MPRLVDVALCTLDCREQKCPLEPKGEIATCPGLVDVEIRFVPKRVVVVLDRELIYRSQALIY